MSTLVTTAGKYELFLHGWTGYIAEARLYTNLDELLDTQSVTFSYSSVTGYMTPTAPIVFSVAAEKYDAAYVSIGYYNPPIGEIPGVWFGFYYKDLPALYDFPTAGELTVSSWQIQVGGTHLTIAGRNDLCPNGWVPLVAWVKLYNLGDELLATVSKTFTANAGTGVFSPTSDIVFEVATGKVAYYMVFGYTSGSDVQLYKRIFSSPYTFTTAGRLTVDSWEITI